MTYGIGSSGGQGGWASRDFDYGIGDDLEQARREVRYEIAAEIRRAAGQHRGADPQVRSAFEHAARIAESPN